MDLDGVFHFSTDHVAPKDRLAVWREVICNKYMCLDVEPDRSFPLRAELRVHRLPATIVAVMRSTPMRYTRTLLHAQKGDNDFTLAWGDGAFHFTNDGGSEVCDVGNAALLLNNKVGSVDVRHQEDMLTVRMNGDMLRGAVQTPDDHLTHCLLPGSVPLRLAREYVGMILRHRSPDTALGHLVNAHIVDLVALALQPTDETRERARQASVPAARFAAIQADVLAHLAKVRLSAKTIAARQGVSERYVYLLFEQNGLSLSRFVTEERLKLALRMLRNPAHAGMRISDIAFAVGFGDLTTFYRAFRRRYGDTPRAVRERGGDGETE